MKYVPYYIFSWKQTINTDQMGDQKEEKKRISLSNVHSKKLIQNVEAKLKALDNTHPSLSFTQFNGTHLVCCNKPVLFGIKYTTDTSSPSEMFKHGGTKADPWPDVENRTCS